MAATGCIAQKEPNPLGPCSMRVHRTLWFGTTKISGLICEAQCVWGSLELTYYSPVDELGWRLQGCIAQKGPNPLGPYSMHMHRTL